jgi:hypothetical protein
MEPGSARQVAEDQIGAEVLLFDPGLRSGLVRALEPAERIGDLDPVQDVDRVVPARRRRRRDGRAYDLRPAFGLLPWLAGFRRALVLRLEVFFDIGAPGYSPPSVRPKQAVPS